MWNSIKIHTGTLDAVTPISSAELIDWKGPLYHLPARKGWQKPPSGAVELSYEPEYLPKLLHTSGLIRETDNVELYQSGVNTFQKWTPERHRATST